MRDIVCFVKRALRANSWESIQLFRGGLNLGRIPAAVATESKRRPTVSLRFVLSPLLPKHQWEANIQARRRDLPDDSVGVLAGDWKLELNDESNATRLHGPTPLLPYLSPISF